MVNLDKVSLPGGKGLLDIFWQLTEASPKRRIQAACDLVRHLLRERNTGDATKADGEPPAQSQPPGVATVDAQKVHNMLSAHKDGSAVPYEMQYAVNRLFQGLASPRPCTRQAHALALLLLLQQLQQKDLPAVRVNFSAFCQNLSRFFALKQAALSEVKQLHIGRCLGVYILLCLNFFRKKQSLPEVKSVFELLWEAFNGKVQLQEASAFLIRQVLRQLTEAGEGQVGLEACERRLRCIGTPQLLAQLGELDKSKVIELGKTATGRLPYSLLEVYVRLQADVLEGFVPQATWLHTDVFSSQKKVQEQSQQSAFLGFRASLLVLQLLKQRLLSPKAAEHSTAEKLKLQRMATTLFKEGKGLIRILLVHLESSKASVSLEANKFADVVNRYSPDWLLSAILCSCAFDVRIVGAKRRQFYAAAVEAAEMREAPRATIPEGMDDLVIPVRSLQLPRLIVFGFDSHNVNDSQQMVGNEHSANAAARRRMQGKLCSLLGKFCVAAMESSTRTEGDAASDYARHIHRAHAQLYQLMQRETSLGESELQLQARSIGCGERKATVFLASRSSFSAAAQELQDTVAFEAFAFLASSQGAALAATAQAAAKQGKCVHKGFVAAAQVVSVALCTVSLLPYLLVKEHAVTGTSEDAQGLQDVGTEEGDTDSELETSATSGSAATAFANSGTKHTRNALQDDLEDLLETWLHAVRVMIEAVKPLYAYLCKCGEEQKDAAVAAQTKLAAISSTLLLFAGTSAPSGLVREVAGGLWRCCGCFASSVSITKLLQVAGASASSPNDGEEDSVKEEASESEEVSEQDEPSLDDSEQEASEQEEEPSQKRQKVDAAISLLDHSDKADDAQTSSNESDDDPYAVQLSADAALKALADHTALPDVYHPPGGFRGRGQSQRKLILRQRRRFGELRLRALAALQVFVQSSRSNPLALYVLTSLYEAYSHALVQAAQSRKRKQKLLVYDDLANKIRRTIDLALKGATASAGLANKAASSECNGSGKSHRKGSSISACYHELQAQHLQALLQRGGDSHRREDAADVLRLPPLMPTLEDGDSMQLYLEGKKSVAFLCGDGEATEENDSVKAPEGKQILVSQSIWALLAEEMAKVLRVCSRKLPPLLANQNQTLGAEILLQLYKLELQTYDYPAENRDQETSLVSNGEMLLPQLLSVALAARCRLRRCHLGWRFFEAVADRRPELFRNCDVYGWALTCRAPFARRKLAQLAFRVYKHPNVYNSVLTAEGSRNSDLQAVQRHLSPAFVLRNLLVKDGGNKAAGMRRLEAACNCELALIPRKALQSGANFSIFVVRRLVELLKQTSELEVREEEQPRPQKDMQSTKAVHKRGSYRHVESEEADGGEKQLLEFSSTAQKQAAVCELLKQLQQLLQAFIRRDSEQRHTAVGAGHHHHKGFREKLPVQLPSVHEIVRDAAVAAGGKKSSVLANAIGSVLSRITPACVEEPSLSNHKAGNRNSKGKRTTGRECS
ncbi:hypothetical protein Emag_000991 [Eimeria magna]